MKRHFSDVPSTLHRIRDVAADVATEIVSWLLAIVILALFSGALAALVWAVCAMAGLTHGSPL